MTASNAAYVYATELVLLSMEISIRTRLPRAFACKRTEAELVQALGRGRAVNRTEQTPLAIDLLFNTCLPVTVDEVNNWVAPSPLIETAREGVMLTSPVDMVRIWPDLWRNTKAAKRTIAMRVPNLPGFQRFTYQPNGPKLKTRVAYLT